MKLELTAEQTRNFWAKVDRGGSTECWNWTGCKIRDGYGTFRCGDRKQLAHRVSWFIAHGEVPAGNHHGTMCVLHHCDNRACVNPDHLFLGSHQDNIRDMVAKGRQSKPKGAANGRAVLTEEAVRRIRNIGKDVNQYVLASEFGVTRQHIGQIINRKRWKHI